MVLGEGIRPLQGRWAEKGLKGPGTLRPHNCQASCSHTASLCSSVCGSSGAWASPASAMCVILSLSSRSKERHRTQPWMRGTASLFVLSHFPCLLLYICGPHADFLGIWARQYFKEWWKLASDQPWASQLKFQRLGKPTFEQAPMHLHTFYIFCKCVSVLRKVCVHDM